MSRSEPRELGSMPHEEPIEGWKSIAKAVRMSVETAQRRARRKHDPLPTWKYEHCVIAWPSALRDWKARNLLPLQVAERLEALNRHR